MFDYDSVVCYPTTKRPLLLCSWNITASPLLSILEERFKVQGRSLLKYFYLNRVARGDLLCQGEIHPVRMTSLKVIVRMLRIITRCNVSIEDFKNGRLRGLAVACWTTDHCHPCLNLSVGLSEGCFIFDFASLHLEVARPI